MTRHQFKIYSILLASVLMCISFLFTASVSADKNTALIADQPVQDSTSKAVANSAATYSSGDNAQTQISGVDSSKKSQDTSSENTTSVKSNTDTNRSTKESTTPNEDSSSQQVMVTVKGTSAANSNSSTTNDASVQAQQGNAQSANSQKSVTLTTPNQKPTVKQETVSLNKSVFQPSFHTHFLLVTVISTVSTSFFPNVFVAEAFNFLWQPWFCSNIR